MSGPFPKSERKESGSCQGLGAFIISSSKRENAEVSFPEHTGIVTGAYCAGQPGGIGKMASTTETGSNINLVIVLGRLQSAMQFLKILYVPETYEESSTVYVQIRGLNSDKSLLQSLLQCCYTEEVQHSQHI